MSSSKSPHGGRRTLFERNCRYFMRCGAALRKVLVIEYAQFHGCSPGFSAAS
jgi:hypothetical protein